MSLSPHDTCYFTMSVQKNYNKRGLKLQYVYYIELNYIELNYIEGITLSGIT